MTAEQFVSAIQSVVVEGSIADTVKLMARPPGRSPGRELLELSAWFNAPPERDREMAQRMLELVARSAVFGFLAVLDGSRTIVDYPSPSDHFELRYVHGAGVDVLSGARQKGAARVALTSS